MGEEAEGWGAQSQEEADMRAENWQAQPWGQSTPSVFDLSGIYISETLTPQMIRKIALAERAYANTASTPWYVAQTVNLADFIESGGWI